MNRRKQFLSRPNIPNEGRTILEHIEYWLVKHGLCSSKLFLKWYRTIIYDGIGEIELNIKDIKYEKSILHKDN